MKTASHRSVSIMDWSVEVTTGIINGFRADGVLAMDTSNATGVRLLYLPPYSPDFNPIEPMWSKIKQILRSHAPRTDEQLLRAAKKAFQSISVADCRGFFFSARYAT